MFIDRLLCNKWQVLQESKFELDFEAEEHYVETEQFYTADRHENVNMNAINLGPELNTIVLLKRNKRIITPWLNT